MIHKEDLGDYKIKYFYLENGIEEAYIVIEDNKYYRCVC